MRIVVDSMIGLMLVGILAGVLLYHRQESAEIDETQFVHESLARLHEAAVLHRVLGSEGDVRAGFPRAVKPEWFDDRLPVNVLLNRRHPWIDVAPPGDFSPHPPDPVADRREQAGFWYNPNSGIFRARVQRQVSERDTLRLYNRINGSALDSAVLVIDSQRTPSPLAPGDLTTALASPQADVVRKTATLQTPPTSSAHDIFSDDPVAAVGLDKTSPPIQLFEDPAPESAEHNAPRERRTLRRD